MVQGLARKTVGALMKWERNLVKQQSLRDPLPFELPQQRQEMLMNLL